MAAELVLGVASQSSLLLPRPPQIFSLQSHFTPFTSVTLQHRSGTDLITYRRPLPVASRAVSSDSKSPSIITDNVNLAAEGIEIEQDTGGGGGDDFVSGGGDGGGGGGGDSGGDGGDQKNEGDGGSEEDGGSKKKMTGMSMSQKLTLGYAALVGMGGLMGYMKSGSSKSLLAGGLSASVLYYVYTQLPTNSAYASSIGLGVSAVLAGVMTSRFMRSKKIFPAGVVSVVSLIMTGGYIHGILRTAH